MAGRLVVIRTALSWLQGLSIRFQVILGLAIGATIVTLVLALLTAYTLERSMNIAKEERLSQAQKLASSLDKLVSRSANGPEDIEELLSLLRGSTTSAAAVIDGQGRLVAVSKGEEAAKIGPHTEIVADLIRERRPGVRVHQLPSGKHIIAFVPLDSVAGGGVLLEEPRDRALTFPLNVLRILPYLGLGIFVITAVSAWLHARYVMHPLGRLERAAARIASGQLDEPITTTRRDEIGQLARSFDVMRRDLKAASEARAWWGQELEQRVQERTAEVQRLVGRVINAQEEERRRLSQELHDDTAQGLASLLMGMETLRDSVPQDQTRVRQHIERTISQGRRALEDLRRVILGLRPAAVDDLGLVVALRSYATARLGPSGVRLDFKLQGKEQRLPEAVEAALFRMLQEAVNNIARHSQAQNARVQFDFQDAQLVATVEDDGQGFDPSQTQAEGRGLGLEGMQERADIINARLEVISSPDKGTKVKVELALEEAADG